MNPLHSIGLLLGWMCILTILGRQLASLLPWKQRGFARLFLAPTLGLAAFVVLSCFTGWLVGTRAIIVVPTTLAIALLSWWKENDRREAMRHLAIVLCIASLVTIGLFLPIWLVGGYNVFNDTVTYLTHAQWLQQHSFRQFAAPTMYEPAFTQVALYQTMGFRMGGSFFLGWIQSASPFTWSIEIYPATVSIALSAGALAIGGLAYALTGQRQFSLGWAVVSGSGISGFAFGAYAGFLPQAFGLSMGTAFLALLVRMAIPAGSWRLQWWPVLPFALLFAATAYAYSELLPLLGISTAVWFFGRLLYTKGQFQTWLAAGACFAVQVLFFLNFECGRIIQALLTQKGALVGWPVPWSAFDFLAHSVGLRTGSGDGDQWLLPPILAGVLFAGVSFASTLLLFSHIARCRTSARWIAPATYTGVCLAGFLYFRFGVDGPWPEGKGQTWNQFKLSNWASPVLLAIIAAVLSCLIGKRRQLIWPLMGIGLALNIHVHHRVLPERINETLRLTGRNDDPFATYIDLRNVALAAEPRGLIHLELGGSEHKSRHLMSYFLHDFRLTADWSGDVYIFPHLPDGWQTLSPADAQWWIRREDNQSSQLDGVRFRSGALVFEPAPKFLAARAAVDGGHGLESDHSGWWIWTKDRVRIAFNVHGSLPARVRVKFTCLGALPAQTLTIDVSGDETQLLKQQVNVKAGWQSVESLSFDACTPKIVVSVSSTGSPVPIGLNDPRLVTSLIKNLRIELAPTR